MQRVLCMFFLPVLVSASTVCGADKSPDTETLLKSVDRTGRVTDAALRERTGIVNLHAFRWAIERKIGKNRFETASAQRTFHTGDEFRLRVTAYTDMHFYLVVKNADGSLDLLLPDKPGGKARLIKRSQVATIPADHTFEFTGATGREELKILASPKPLPWRMARQLFNVRHGQKLRSKQQAALARLKSLGDSKSAVESIDPATIQVDDTLRKSFERRKPETGTRGIGLVYEATAAGELVCFTSGSSADVPLLMGRMILKHRRKEQQP